MNERLMSAVLFTGRLLLAAFFAAGCIQKLLQPEVAQALLEARGFPRSWFGLQCCSTDLPRSG